jgi:hypothetical protein
MNDNIEMIKIYFEESKYRHDHFWSLFFKFSNSILFLIAVPYVRPQEFTVLANYDFVFPLLGGFLSIVAAWILAAEYERIRVTDQKYNELKTLPYKQISMNLTGFKRILKYRVGTIVTITFLFGFLAASIFDFIILMNIH